MSARIKLGHDGVGVTGGVDKLARAAHLAHNVGVLKVAHDLADGVGLANVGQELVAQAPRPRWRPSPGLRCRRTRPSPAINAARVDNIGELLQAAIGHVNDTHVRVDAWRTGSWRQRPVFW